MVIEQEIEEKVSLNSSQGFKRSTFNLNCCLSNNESFSDNRSNHSSKSNRSSFYNIEKLNRSKTAKAYKSSVERPGIKDAPVSIFGCEQSNKTTKAMAGLPPQSPKKSSPQVKAIKKAL